MKKAVVIFLLLIVIVMFSACAGKSVTVIGSDGKSYELVADENGEPLSDSSGNIFVESSDKNGNTVTQVLADNYLMVDGNKLKSSSYNYEIPDDFELKSSGSDPLIENKQGTIQFNIMDKTDSAKNFDEYVSDTYNAAVASGIANGELEDVTISDIQMKRFEMSVTDDDGTQLKSYVYIAKIGNRVLMITLTSKDGGISDVVQADAFVAEINFNSR